MSAVSETAICNLALTLLGEARITSLAEDRPAARECAAAYERIRDIELAKHPWNFAKTRVTLAADSTEPAFDFDYAFVLPADCLRVLLPNTYQLDWSLENHNGDNAILTNDGDSIDVRYIQRVTDPTKFSAPFVAALAAALAMHLAERLTQSNEKKASAENRYKDAIRDARRANAFQTIPEDPPDDLWFAGRESGGSWQK